MLSTLEWNMYERFGDGKEKTENLWSGVYVMHMHLFRTDPIASLMGQR